MRVVVAQKGAREHFLAARALHQRGQLAQLVVDWYSPSNPWLCRIASSLLGRASASALGVRAETVPDNMVTPLRLLGLWCKWRERAAARRGRPYEGFDRTDAAFARKVARLRLPEHEAFFGYSYASLEMLAAEKSRGRFTILDQIDPGPLEWKLVAQEMALHPELAGAPGRLPSGHFERARQEWALANLIVVNSEWSRDALVAEGADAEKIEVLPLAYEVDHRPPGSPIRRWHSSREPLRVLWLGQVNVRKGIHYMIEAARLLEKDSVEFTVAGPIGIRESVINSAPKNMRWLGAVPRSQVPDLYSQCDVFVLPTLSDGFAITQLEALAHGLPVIITPNCGRVVEEGVTGFIIPPRDANALASALRRFIQHSNLAADMAGRCVRAAQEFSIASYGDGLNAIAEERTHNPPKIRTPAVFA